MKAFLATLLVSISALAVLAQIPPGINPHEGIRFRTPWNHKGTKRYQPPKAVVDAYNAIQHTWATDGNLDRPFMPRFFIALINARKPELVESWEIVEYAQIERQPLEGGKVRYNWNENARDFSQPRLFLPATKYPDGSPRHGKTYTIKADYDTETRERLGIIDTPGQWGHIEIAKAIQLHGSGKMKLGGMCWYYPARTSATKQAFVSFSNDLIVDKDGKKFLRTLQGGKSYLIPMELEN